MDNLKSAMFSIVKGLDGLESELKKEMANIEGKVTPEELKQINEQMRIQDPKGKVKEMHEKLKDLQNLATR